MCTKKLNSNAQVESLRLMMSDLEVIKELKTEIHFLENSRMRVQHDWLNQHQEIASLKRVIESFDYSIGYIYLFATALSIILNIFFIIRIFIK